MPPFTQGSNLTLKSTHKILQVLFEATSKMKNQLAILLFALYSLIIMSN